MFDLLKYSNHTAIITDRGESLSYEALNTEVAQNSDTETIITQEPETEITETEITETEITETEITESEVPEPEQPVNTENKKEENQNTSVVQKPEQTPLLNGYPYYIKVNRAANCVTIYINFIFWLSYIYR